MTSSELFARAKKVCPGGVNSPVRAFKSVGGEPFFTRRAVGSRLITQDGTELIDYVGTWGPAIHGHNCPEIREAVAEALDNGTSFGTPNPYEVEMAELLVEMVPSLEKVRMVNSGTEATMSAIRLARGFTGRDKIIKFAGCYHGHVDSLLVKAGSGALTLGNPNSGGVPKSFAETTLVLPYNDVSALEAAFAEHGSEIAGVIIEPYPANCGLILPDAGYLAKLREICTKNSAVLIFDEVMTGFRVAPGGVQEREGVTPDLTAMGKIIGGGLPVGAFGGRADIMAHLAPEGPVYQAGTLSGNPLAMAAGIAALKKLRKEMPYAALDQRATQLHEGISAAAREKGLPLQVPRVPGMFAMFFMPESPRDGDSATHTATAQFNQVFHHALKHGVYLPPSNFETCFISTCHTDTEIEQTLDVIAAGIRLI